MEFVTPAYVKILKQFGCVRECGYRSGGGELNHCTETNSLPRSWRQWRWTFASA